MQDALDLLTNLGDDQYRRVIDLVSHQDADMLDGLFRTSHAGLLWPIVIPIAAEITDPANVISALRRADATVVKSCVAAVAEHALWVELRALMTASTTEQRLEFRRLASKNRQLSLLRPVKDLFECDGEHSVNSPRHARRDDQRRRSPGKRASRPAPRRG